MTPAVLALVACGVAVWPSAVPLRRLRRLSGALGDQVPRKSHREVVGIALSIVVGALAFDVGGAFAGAIVSATVWRVRRGQRGLTEAIAALSGLAEALRGMVAELSAGAHPEIAARSVARDAHPATARVLERTVAFYRLGEDATTPAKSETAFDEAVAQVARAWRLATEHGLPLAATLDAVRADLDHRVRFARTVLSRLAGARASAAVLAGMPVLGVGMGEVIGAAPLDVLASTTAGQLLLPLGTALASLGVVWSVWITEQTVLAPRFSRSSRKPSTSERRL